jgi:ubiquinone/menaquinone biosynthesis C-methylase UbiE
MNINTSWHQVGSWYNKLVGDQGHYYHQHVVLPGVLKLLQLTADSTLLDVGCGQGVLAHQLPPNLRYVGVDQAASLLNAAQQQDRSANHSYVRADVTKPFVDRLPIKLFSHAICILALQNMDQAEAAIRHTATCLAPQGTLVIVLNHPCFRIPRQSSWEMDEKNKLEYRRINRYLSPLKIPIQAAPSRGQQSEVTWSFHQPLQYYVQALAQAGLVVDALEEWGSDKVSVGKAAKAENRARQEFPLFLALRARKL